MKYGIVLASYKGQEFDMWVYNDKGRFETDDSEEAHKVKRECSARNPGGLYVVKEIEEKKDV